MKMDTLLAQEQAGVIQLYKQGLFWVAYEQSAYSICKYKSYKVNCKWIKYLNKYVLSIGFPDASLSLWQNEPNFTFLEDEINYKKIKDNQLFEQNQFLIWHQKIVENNTISLEKISLEDKILSFPLEKKSPIEAFLFLQNIQQHILNKN